MAVLKRSLRRKNATGNYDTIRLESDSSIVYRPSGRTVEQDLAAYLPSTQSSDVVPKTLNFGKIVTGTSRLYAGVLNNIVELETIPNNRIDTSDATAYAANIQKGYTAYARGNKITGSLVPLNTSDATAVASDIASGKTAYVKGKKITGTADIMDYLLVGRISGSKEVSISVPSKPDFFFPISCNNDHILSDDDTDLPVKLWILPDQYFFRITYTDSSIDIFRYNGSGIYFRYCTGKYKM